MSVTADDKVDIIISQIFLIILGVVAKQYFGVIATAEVREMIKFRLTACVYKPRAKTAKGESVTHDKGIIKEGHACFGKTRDILA